MAVYELIQYGCDNCGDLTEVMDTDQQLPEGWVWVPDTRHGIYCPKCAKKLSKNNKGKVKYGNRHEYDK